MCFEKKHREKKETTTTTTMKLKYYERLYFLLYLYDVFSYIQTFGVSCL